MRAPGVWGGEGVRNCEELRIDCGCGGEKGQHRGLIVRADSEG